MDEKTQYFVKFNVDGLLRGDYQSRMNGYAIGRQNGWLSTNDIRELEDLPQVSEEQGGNDYLVLLAVGDVIALNPNVILLAECIGFRNDLLCGFVDILIRIALAALGMPIGIDSEVIQSRNCHNLLCVIKGVEHYANAVFNAH